ncbi:bifunctional glutamate N-acetyltransferase/amino-acid acetyltransferase ArgJ [Citricoccus muralis]|uniref:Arginine biosynthesis bifunctional protein ArgJ n=1 Tax=Citricoccus muralis TaxID=169134 RepID=A0ABY8H4J7_9MICC|nr:bifunctional glutamate N-acetyltransferase/amino-acid acetyltransferase ArgJ [Citricoccus muralis]WFP15603.1 bifunctional glutamate N-acetyltransferase/amino-acid acetyltransferase ArgJ [Citricoccus muralis]
MSVTAAQGFRASGIAAGIKSNGNPDLALVVNDGPDHHAAAVFTSNRVVAAPVIWSRQAITDGRADAVVLNSGGANACTGAPGFQDAHATAEKVAGTLGLSALDVQVCSTGLIGERLPMPELLAGVDKAAGELSEDGGDAAAVAIMTTDSVPKTAVVSGAGYQVGGMTKGAGMIAPGMATMLAVVTTDAVVDPATLTEHLQDAVRVSFNRADSDGCMSTNDTVILLASGASGVTPDPAQFRAELTELCSSLARQIIADAEGASHDIAITVVNAASETDAEEAARAVARSNLFKTAIFGRDPNWGRVLAAVGTTDAEFEADQLDVSINGVQVCRAGGIGDSRDLVDLEPREVQVLIDLHAGEQTATIWTNDLTHEYVHENSVYSS